MSITEGAPSQMPETLASYAEHFKECGRTIGLALGIFGKSISETDALEGALKENGTIGLYEISQERVSLVAEDSTVVEARAFGALNTDGTTDYVHIDRRAADLKKIDSTGIAVGMYRGEPKHHTSKLTLTYRHGKQINHSFDTGVRITVEDGAIKAIHDLESGEWVEVCGDAFDQIDFGKMRAIFCENWDRLAGILEVMKLRVES